MKGTPQICVSCTWGDGPDVLVHSEGHPALLLEEPTHLNRLTHGAVAKWQLDLTSQEALTFANRLRVAALQAQELDHNFRSGL